MPKTAIHFPAGFLWGTATASHQVEGGNTNNNWYQWETQPGKIKEGMRSGLACNWWGGKWKEDLDRAAEGHQNSHRMSIEWSRVQPSPDRWDEDALEYYRQIIRGMVDRKLEPMVTLHHFTDPLWVTNLGGWETGAVLSYFERYVKKVVEALKDYVKLWVTINEPNVYVWGGYMGGGFPPGKNDMNLALQVMANMVRGHAAAYRTIHAAQPDARVGFALNYRDLQPARPDFPPDCWMAGLQAKIYNDSFAGALKTGKLDMAFKKISIPEAAGTQDYLGINYYTGDLVKFDLSAGGEMFGRRSTPPGAEMSETGFIAKVTEGMFRALSWARKFGIPLMVTENGVEDSDDHLRPRYLVEHLEQVWRAANYNFRVQGYYHWSLVDNFEWERGWTQRWGLWGLDRETQARIRRPSADLYAAICRENGLTQEMVERWAAQSAEKLFP
ncbi:MAG: glycoside hydrolase family 1 protein [Leptolinea sp.]|jgi:beta-glucosidase|nr:glycoside hydrolase family 1 protein [Leptolinea sp.]